MKTLYETQATAIGGRAGSAASADGALRGIGLSSHPEGGYEKVAQLAATLGSARNQTSRTCHP